MNFRLYQKADEEKCLELFRSNTPKFFTSNEEAEFSNYLDDNPDEYFVLEHPDMIGCGGYGVEGETAYLAWGMVHNTQHGTGAGKRLLLERLNLIVKRSDIKEIILDMSQHTFGFFEKLGFVVQKITQHGYGENLHRYDMKLVLDEGSRQQLSELLLRTKSLTNNIVNNQEKSH
ncbi:MAG: GNAT family N-acetyltransferase [Trueperaceae bacterium]